MTNVRHVKSSVRVSRRWAALVAALSLALSLASPSSAASPASLTISGSGSGWVEITLTKPTRFNDHNVTVSGHGRYIGLFLDSTTRVGLDYTWVHFPGTSTYTVNENDGGGLGVGTNDGDPLPAGRYRAYLLTEGPGSMSIPVQSGTSTLRLHPTHATHPRYRSAALRQSLMPSPGGVFSASAAYPVNATPRNVAIMQLAASWTSPAQKLRIHTCFTAAGDSDCFPTLGRVRDTGALVTGTGGGKIQDTTYTLRGGTPYGHIQALFTAESTPQLPVLRAAVLDSFL